MYFGNSAKLSTRNSYHLTCDTRRLTCNYTPHHRKKKWISCNLCMPNLPEQQQQQHQQQRCVVSPCNNNNNNNNNNISAWGACVWAVRYHWTSGKRYHLTQAQEPVKEKLWDTRDEEHLLLTLGTLSKAHMASLPPSLSTQSPLGLQVQQQQPQRRLSDTLVPNAALGGERGGSEWAVV